MSRSRRTWSPDSLTSREQVILQLMAQRLSNQEIAQRLFLSLNTVKWYNKQIFSKLGVTSRADACKQALELSLVADPQIGVISDITTVHKRTQLPSYATPFVGRGQDVERLIEILTVQGSRLVTILAQGGMGKSRLAAQVADQMKDDYRSGVVYVPLASVPSSNLLSPAIADALGVQPSLSRSPHQQVLDFLTEKRLLLVLDNFEHLLDGVLVISDILRFCPKVQVIVTSRERLKISDETVFVLGGMLIPEGADAADANAYAAVQLFIDRARRVQPSFNADDLDSVCQICRVVGGMPLAIELAAAWANTLEPSEILAEISSSLDFLQASLADIPERMRSIRAVFDWAWSHMTEDERGVFSHLWVFRDGCTRAALEAITGAKPAIISRLVDKGLLWKTALGDRFSVHDVMGQFAFERMANENGASAVRLAHARFYLSNLAETRRKLEGERQLETVNRLNRDRENIYAAFLTALEQNAIEEVSASLHSFWLYHYVRGLYAEGVRILKQGVWHCEQYPASPQHALLKAALYAYMAFFYAVMLYAEEAQAALNEVKLASAPLPDAELSAFCAVAEGWLHSFHENHDESVTCFERALAAYSQSGDTWGVGLALLGIGRSYCMREYPSASDIAEARRYLREALSIHQRIGDVFHMAYDYRELAIAVTRDRDYAESSRLHYLSLEHHQLLDNLERVATDLVNLGVNESEQGNFAAARSFTEKGQHLCREVGDRARLSKIPINLSHIAFEQGDLYAAHNCAEDALRTGASDYPMGYDAALHCLGRAYLYQGHYEAALRQLDAALERAILMSDTFAAVDCQISRAAALRCLANFDEAAECLKDATALLERRDVLRLRLLIELEFIQLDMELGNLEAAAERIRRCRLSLVSENVKIDLSVFEENAIYADLLASSGRIAARQGRDEEAYRALRSALLVPHLGESPPRVLRLLTDAAEVFASRSDSKLAVALVGYVGEHSHAYAVDKRREHLLLSSLHGASTEAARLMLDRDAATDQVVGIVLQELETLLVRTAAYGSGERAEVVADII